MVHDGSLNAHNEWSCWIRQKLAPYRVQPRAGVKVAAILWPPRGRIGSTQNPADEFSAADALQLSRAGREVELGFTVEGVLVEHAPAEVGPLVNQNLFCAGVECFDMTANERAVENTHAIVLIGAHKSARTLTHSRTHTHRHTYT